MDINLIKNIDIEQYDLPNEVSEVWYEMVNYIEFQQERKLDKLKLYFEVFLHEMESKGYTRDEVRHEFILYFQQMNKLKQMKESIND